MECVNVKCGRIGWRLLACVVLSFASCGDNSADPVEVVCDPSTPRVCLGDKSVGCDADGFGVSVEVCSRTEMTCERGVCVRPVSYADAPNMPVGEGAGSDVERTSTSPSKDLPGGNIIPEQPAPEPRVDAPESAKPPEREGTIIIRESQESAPRAAPAQGCPRDMAWMGMACMDRYEAPNRQGAYPLIMYSFNEADAWCSARGKRLCYDDEWTRACSGPRGTAYPYGVRRQPGRCNDDKLWRRYDGPLLRKWPRRASGPEIASLDEQYTAAGRSASGAESVEHVRELYQGTRSGAKRGCGGHYGVYDLVGNVEEWTRRRDGGDGGVYVGRLKGRFWGEARTCQSGVSNHGNAFRFYETGFRCCMDPRGD